MKTKKKMYNGKCIIYTKIGKNNHNLPYFLANEKVDLKFHKEKLILCVLGPF